LARTLYLLVRCSDCGRYTGMKVGTKRRQCPYCGARIAPKQKSSSRLYQSNELAEAVKVANMTLQEGSE